MGKNFNFWVDKWIKGECRHLCKFCKHFKLCMKERYGLEEDNRRLVIKTVKLSCLLEHEMKKSVKEQSRLHAIIEDLTSDIDKAEETAYEMQEEIEELKKKLKAEKEASKELSNLYLNAKYGTLNITTIDRMIDVYGTDAIERRIKEIKECGLTPK